MGACLDLWDVSAGHPKAREELERLTRIEETLEKIASHGCGCAQKVGEKWLSCADLSSDQGNWCWCCIAREALKDA